VTKTHFFRSETSFFCIFVAYFYETTKRKQKIMNKKTLLAAALMLASALSANAQTGKELPFQTWALTPPMGWNSWDCFGPTVVESEVKANADYMAEHLAEYGWEYIVVDIRWFIENDKAGGYNQTDARYCIDANGRYTPAVNRFPSAADGTGFKKLADYVHSKGLKFGIHLMRGIPREAVARKLPILGTDGITCDRIANNDSICTWLRDNKTVDCTKKGAQEYYNSCFDMYASWGVDFVKIDDLSRPYHTGEIELIRNAITHCGRPMVLSMSPGETPVEMAKHAQTHANMWRTVDDFWDNWSQLSYQFEVCAKWAPYIAPGTWPDADMLPMGKISIRGERGAERWSAFTPDELKTMMNLWGIFKSPLMFGGDLPQNDEATNALLTNRNMLYMHHYSVENKQLSRTEDNIVTWTAVDPANGDRFVALFNLGGSAFVNAQNALYRSGTISYLTTGYATDIDIALPKGSRKIALVATDGGDTHSCDHADWIAPTVTLQDGSTVDLTQQEMITSTCGWGEVHVNRNLNGGDLSINGTKYEKGVATHANSVIVYNLPKGAVRFTAKAGIDNTGTNQGSISSVEFMVFNYDPTSTEEGPAAHAGDKKVNIDLTQLGFDKKQPCTVTEVWSGKSEGNFRGSKFSTTLKEHASALYRISGQKRAKGAGVHIDIAGLGGEEQAVTLTVTGGDTKGAYVQLRDNGKVIGCVPVEVDGRAHYTARFAAGAHTLEALYSGTASTQNAVATKEFTK
jgi:hypothetical protein